jgi:hypothetical protein
MDGLCLNIDRYIELGYVWHYTASQKTASSIPPEVIEFIS